MVESLVRNRMFMLNTPFLNEGQSTDAKQRHLYIYKNIRQDYCVGFVSRKKLDPFTVWPKSARGQRGGGRKYYMNLKKASDAVDFGSVIP